MSKKVLVPIADGTEELEAVSIIDVLRRAGADVTVASVSGLQITASRGTKLVADKLISECLDEAYDLIALPGGIPGAEHLRDSEELTGLLKKHRAQDRYLGAVCAAPAVVLEHHGLVGGRRITAHPGFINALQNKDAVESRVVMDGELVTSRGAGTAVEFALALVELLYGREKADETAGPMLAVR